MSWVQITVYNNYQSFSLHFLGVGTWVFLEPHNVSARIVSLQLLDCLICVCVKDKQLLFWRGGM